jgi:arylsulfatase
METWPDSAYSPFRSAKGSTWEGGQRVPGIVSWPGMIEPDRVSDGLFCLMDLFTTSLRLAGVEDSIPDDRYIDAVDQTSFLLAPDADSNRKYMFYWLGSTFSALRVAEWKFMLASTSDDDRDVMNVGGFTGVTQKYTYGRLYNLYLDPKETRSYMVRKLAYLEAFQKGIMNHVRTFAKYPPKTVVGGVG